MIYLDHAAATPVSTKVLKAMEPYFADQFFNPSAAYLPAKRVREVYEDAKNRIAHTIGAKGVDLVITAGATEATNIAFVNFSNILVLETEHDSVLKTALARGGQTIKVDKNGLINLADLKSKITADTELISVALANNELGAIQPLSEIAEIIRAERLRRLQAGNTCPLYLHSDASQGMNLIDINVARMGVDLMTLNAAKIYGPKGVGALYVSHDVRLKPITLGGGQENGLRSGTENVPGVVGFATATEEAKSHLSGNRKKYENFKKIFLAELKNYKLLNQKNSLANFVAVCFEGVDAERVIYKLEEQEVYVSTGAACAASKGEKSHVLKAIGLSNAEIAGSLRITFGTTNTEADIKKAAQLINAAVESERGR